MHKCPRCGEALPTPDDADRAEAERYRERYEALAPEGYIQRCTACCGRGRRDYPDTSTWRGGGYAGQVITTDICDRCWGTGDEARPGTDLRAMVQEYRERLEWAMELAAHEAIKEVTSIGLRNRKAEDIVRAAVQQAKERLAGG